MNLARWMLRIALGRRMPIISGRLVLPGLRQAVRIRRDRWGIPYIEAENDADAWFGLGFCQGQDRSFQIECQARAARGALSELFGRRALAADRLSRRIGFRRSSLAQLAALDPERRESLEAFARGVTAGARAVGRGRAHEFAILRARPSRFTAADVLGILKLTSFGLAANWDSEMVRLKVLDLDGAAALAAVDPAAERTAEAAPVPPGGQASAGKQEDCPPFQAWTAPGGGSNNWALAPWKTASGRPILANDPHLPPLLPPFWYLAHLRTPEWAAAGASFAGTPGISAGHNGVLAWGITAGLADNTDLFIEEVGPDGCSVRGPDGFVTCELRREEIAVRGAASAIEEVLITPRGPVIGPSIEGERRAISLRATWLDAGLVGGFLGAQRARTAAELRECFRDWPFLTFNLVHASSEGTIGWMLAGRAPRRRGGSGALPLPGRLPEAGWEADPVPFEHMPRLDDPPEGFAASANSRPPREKGGPDLGDDWIDAYRLERIREALAERGGWDIAGAMALQLDDLSPVWREIRARVLALAPRSADAATSLELLKMWNGRVAADSPAAAVFELFLAALARRVVEAKAPRAAAWALGKGLTAITPHTTWCVRRAAHLARLLREQPPGWFERPWEEEIEAALARAAAELRARCGPDPAGWAWGRARPLTLKHPLGAIRLFRRAFDLGPFPWGGDANTVGQSAADPLDPTSNPLFIASMRLTIDVGDWDASRYVLPGGQSGNPLSPHYDDQLPLWRRGDGIPIACAPARIDGAVGAELILEPDTGTAAGC